MEVNLILNIRKLGDPILRSEAKKVDNISDKTTKLIDNMIETMYSADGVGLAAPQVGVLKKIVVIDIGEELIEMINPEIIKKDGQQTDEEGCLSIPEKTGVVKRAEKIRVKAVDREGEKFEIEAEGLLARVIQHEIDHLNGKLFIDKMINKDKIFLDNDFNIDDQLI